MKFKIETKKLQGICRKLIPIVNERAVIPILNSFLFEPHNEGFNITASNQSVEITGFVKPLEFDELNQFTIPAHKLLSVISEIKEDEIVITIKGNKFQIKVPGRRTKLNISLVSDFTFPRILSENKKFSIDINPKDFSQAIQKASRFTGMNDTRVSVNSVNIIKKDNTIQFCATDTSYGCRLIVPNQSEFDYLIIPKHAATVIENIETANDFSLDVYSNHILLSTNVFTMKVMLEEAKPMPFDSVIRIPNKSRVFNRMELIDKLRLLANLSVQSEKVKKSVVFNFADETKIESHDVSGNYSGEDFIDSISGEGEASICFNVSNIMTMLRTIEGDEVEILFAESNSQAMYMVDNNDKDRNELFLIMPIII